MFELIVGLALLPFAVITLLLLLGVIIFTWRLIVTALILLAALISFFIVEESLGKVVILVLTVASLTWLWSTSSLSENNSDTQSEEVPSKEVNTTLITYMKRKKRFTVKDIKNEFKIINNIEARRVIDEVQSTGLIEPEGAFSLHWRVVTKNQQS